MSAAESRAGVKADSHPPLPGKLRVLLAVACVAAFAAAPLTAQTSSGDWAFEDDAFADLWFHGLAVVGYYGFGPMPLYDPAYVLEARRERAERGVAATGLEADRARFLEAFRSDEAFEILHFVPAYFRGAGRTSAMEALGAIASAPSGTPTAGDRAARLGTEVVARLLPGARQRKVLGAFLDRLREEWSLTVEPRRASTAAARRSVPADVRSRWIETYQGPLAPFLEAEGLSQGTAVLSAALGTEGRFVPPSAELARPPVVALALPGADVTVDAVLSSLVRELCYPAVRRALEPFEARLGTRVEASRVSDLAATRCGELLLEQYAPTQVAAFRDRFDVPQSGTGPGFLSAHGRMVGAAALEGDIQEALARELNIHRDGVRADAPPVGRH